MEETTNKVEEAAIKTVLKEMGKMTTINPDGLYYFKPALHVDPSHGHVYVSVPLAIPKIIKGTPRLDTETVVVYRNGTFPLNEDELVARGIFPRSLPALPFPPRWDMNDIKEFTSSVGSVEGVVVDGGGISHDVYDYDTYSTIKDILEYFLDLPVLPEYTLYTVWIMMTYIFPIFNAVPFINLTGFSGSGKSKIIAFFQQTCFNAESTNNVSPAALFHIVEENMSTILIDEAEKLTGLEKDPDLRLLLNACYKKGGAVVRWNADTRRAERSYPYCPAAIAAINSLENTLSTRSISRVNFKTITKKGSRELNDQSYDWQSLRNRLYRFIFTASEEIEKIYLTETFEGLNCRHLEKWKPLLCIAKYLDAHGGEGKIFTDISTLAQEEQEETESLTETEEITIRSVDKLVTIGGEYFIKEIKNGMVAILEEEGNAKAIEFLSNKAIASILRKFGFHAGKRQNKGIPYRINPDQIEIIYKRYGVARYPTTPITLPTPIEANERDAGGVLI